ncbi:hypothetical protein [Amycolatopsis panacis]|nr:hypothetical protein [Amycolatopsis panacis]
MITIATATALAVSGCANSTGSGTTPTSPATSVSGTAGPAQPQCADVVAKGQALATTVLQFVNGSATPSDVQSAVQNFSTALDSAHAALAPAVGTHVDNAQTDVRKLVDALQAQPVDVAGVRAAANALAVDLRGIATVCSTTSPTAPPTS